MMASIGDSVLCVGCSVAFDAAQYVGATHKCKECNARVCNDCVRRARLETESNNCLWYKHFLFTHHWHVLYIHCAACAKECELDGSTCIFCLECKAYQRYSAISGVDVKGLALKEYVESVVSVDEM